MNMQKSVTFVKKKLKINMSKTKKYRKVRDHCHYTQENIEVLCIAYVT